MLISVRRLMEQPVYSVLVRNTITALTISLKHVHELAKLRSLETHLLMLMMSVLALENFAHKSASVSANFSEILTS